MEVVSWLKSHLFVLQVNLCIYLIAVHFDIDQQWIWKQNLMITA